MGSCLSSPEFNSDDFSQKPISASVVLSNGNLRRYPTPVTVSSVLEMESTLSYSYFMCNSDRLYYEDYIPALSLDDELQPGLIYFILPISKLRYRLTASDMAALAVKASVALQSSNGGNNSSKGYVRSLVTKKENKKKKPNQISPLLQLEEEMSNEDRVRKQSPVLKDEAKFKKNSGDKTTGVTRSSSTRRMQRYSSRRAKMAVRSFKLRLTTIYEGSVLQFY